MQRVSIMRNSIRYEDWLENLANLLEHDRQFEPPEMACTEALALARRLQKPQEKHAKTQALFEFAIDDVRLSVPEQKHLSTCQECKEFVVMCRRWQGYLKKRPDRAA